MSGTWCKRGYRRLCVALAALLCTVLLVGCTPSYPTWNLYDLQQFKKDLKQNYPCVARVESYTTKGLWMGIIVFTDGTATDEDAVVLLEECRAFLAQPAFIVARWRNWNGPMDSLSVTIRPPAGEQHHAELRSDAEYHVQSIRSPVTGTVHESVLYYTVWSGWIGDEEYTPPAQPEFYRQYLATWDEAILRQQTCDALLAAMESSEIEHLPFLYAEMERRLLVDPAGMLEFLHTLPRRRQVFLLCCFYGELYKLPDTAETAAARQYYAGCTDDLIARALAANTGRQ